MPTNTRLSSLWTQDIPLYVRAMVLADKTLFVAGPPDIIDEEQTLRNFADPEVQAKLAEQSEALESEKGALLWAVSYADGHKLAEYKLDAQPVFDGMAAAGSRLYMATVDPVRSKPSTSNGVDGRVLCLAGTK